MGNRIVNNIVPIFNRDSGDYAKSINAVFVPSIKNIMVDENDTLGLSTNGIYEPLITELIKHFVKSGDTVLDFGACIGYHTLIFSSLVGENGKVFAFEPEDRNFSILRKNIELNNCRNVTLSNTAVSNITKSDKLYLSSTNIGDHRLFDSHDDRDVVNVNIVSPVDYFGGKNLNVDFIKIDTQGSEFHIILGLLPIIKNKSVKLICEFCPYMLAKNGINALELIDLLLTNRFLLYHINDYANSVEPLDVNLILDKYSINEDVSTNLYCIKNG